MATQSPHRYWRLYLTAGGNVVFGIAELQFRTTPGTPLLFSGGTVIASSYYQSDPTYQPSHAADNNPSTLWASATTNSGEWWEYDYGGGSALAIQEFTITARNDSNYSQAPASFQLQFSDDNTTWTAAYFGTAGAWSSGQTQVFTIPLGPVLAQVTQVALEEWAAPNPLVQVTQTALETWASVALYTPPSYVPPPPPAPGKGKGGKGGGKGGQPPLQFGAPALQAEVERFGELRLVRPRRRPQVIFRLPAALLLSESAVTSAALAATVAHAAALSASAAASDAIVGGRILAALLSAGAAASDAFASALGAPAALAETSHAAGAPSATAHMVAQLAAAAATSDLPRHGVTLSGALSEGASTTAAITALLATQAHLADGSAANAAIAGFRTLVAGLAETAAGLDAIAGRLGHGARLSEGSAAAESLSALAAFIAAIAEETGSEDAPAAVKLVHATIAEAASTLDADKWLATTRPFRRAVGLQGERSSPDLEGRQSSPDLIGRRSSPDLVPIHAREGDHSS